MARASKNASWWLKKTFEEFDKYGYVLAFMSYGNEVTIRIAIQPGDDCLTGKPLAGCRRACYELTEKAIAKAEELYKLVNYEFSIIHRKSHPMESTLELTITEKDKS